MQPHHHDQLVQALARARSEVRQIEPLPTTWRLHSTDEAERVMLSVANLLAWPTMGWKVAATNMDMQRRLRVAAPVFGRTFLRFLSQAPASFLHDELLDPIVECEFMFRLGRSLLATQAPHSEATLRTAITCVHPGVEVGECRFSRVAELDPRLLMADGFGSGRYVIGEQIPHWQSALDAGMDVRLSLDGVERSVGRSSDVMGHPVRALAWLANRLAWHGVDLLAGELVSSGSCTGMVRARKGNRMSAKFGNTSSFELSFD